MPFLQTTFISVNLILSSQDLEKQVPPCLPWRKNSGSQQPGACSWCSLGKPHFKPLISCPGFLLSTKALIPTSYKCPMETSMKYRLFSRSVYFWLWKGLRDISNFFFLFSRPCEEMTVCSASPLGPGSNPKLSLCFHLACFQESLCCSVTWRSPCRILYSTLTGWPWQESRHQNKKGCGVGGVWRHPPLCANSLSGGGGPQRPCFWK